MAACILLYNVTGPKEAAIGALCARLGLRCVAVPPSHQGATIGEALRGGAAKAAFPPFRQEMLVMDLERGLQMDLFLQGLMDSGADVALKAVITPTNVGWTAPALARELQRERTAMMGKGGRG